MRYVALLFAALCLLAPTAAVAAGAPPAGPPQHGALAPGDALAAVAFEDPDTSFVVSVREDRSARWNVTTTFRFGTAADRAAFRTYAARYEAGEAAGGPAPAVFRNAARIAENETGREMAIRNVNRTARLVNETTGVLSLRFTWTGFVGESESGQLVLADVFRVAEDTTWFRTLRAGQRLVIEPPDGFTISDAPVGIENGRAVIAGPAALDAEDLAIRFEMQDRPAPWWSTQWALVAFVAAGVALAAAVAVLLYRRGVTGSDGEEPPSPAANGDSHSPGPAGGGAATQADGNGGASTVDELAGAGADGPTEEELELLSDEERVERLLDRNGGRMRQAAIVSETGWSDAKVSQLLSAMADEGRVEKLRLGRENLISLPDFDAEE